MTPRGIAHTARMPRVRRLVRACSVALLASILWGCSDQGPLSVPANPWTRVTNPATIPDPYYPEWRGDSIAFEYFTKIVLPPTDTLTVIRLGIMHEDGAAPRFFSRLDPTSDLFPRWVTDSTLAFSSTRSGNYDIWYLNTRTGLARRLTTFATREFSPAPRPGSPCLAYTTGSQPLQGRITLIPDTAAVPLKTAFVTPDTMSAGEPDWDPAGQEICFSVQMKDGSSHIWKAAITAVDTTLTELTTGSAHDLSPRWSPDGAKIVFTSDRDGRSGLWYVSPNGGPPSLISYGDHKGALYSPSWSPDGTAIAVSSNAQSTDRAIWILNDLGF